MRNYFRTGLALFIFDDNDLDSTRKAWRGASSAPNGTPTLFAPVPFDGPWDAAGLVGFRARREILVDMHRTLDRIERMVEERTHDVMTTREAVLRAHLIELDRERVARDEHQFRRRPSSHPMRVAA